MLKIRRIYDDLLPTNKESLGQIQEILRNRFPDADQDEIDQIGEKLRNPFKQRFNTILLSAENLKGKVKGFAMLLHDPLLSFVYLDWIATAIDRTGGGLGSALYERIRQESKALKAKGLFFECLPDEWDSCPDSRLIKENRARLKFYERYGARPVINTAYESPVNPGDTCMPHLVYDELENKKNLNRRFARKVVRAILERKYADLCPAEYVTKVVNSFKDDPVKLRGYRYIKPETARTEVLGRIGDPIALLVNDRHDIHHIHERGYVESPVRIRSILGELEQSGLFVRIPPKSFAERYLHGVHDVDFANYLRRASREVPEGKSLYPYIFPIRNKTRPPKEPSVLSGYYCIDTFTPIHQNAYLAARRGVDCALTAAEQIIGGRRLAYALVRPPGHHAERRAFGGFCYFNNNAIAAQYLSGFGKVAVLDIDYHHGNGQQDIFYRRMDILTISIHGHPSFAYPYFSGFEDEQGEDDGEGFNLNLPLPEKTDGPDYRKALTRAIERIEDYDPQFLVIALGLDTAKGDPTGTWSLLAKDFEENGRLIGAMGLPTLVIQEGGYRNRTLGKNASAFFSGLALASQSHVSFRKESKRRLRDLVFRDNVQHADEEKITRLMKITGIFQADEIETVVKQVKEAVKQPENRKINFILCEQYGRLIAFAVFGATPFTDKNFAIQYLTVLPDFRGLGAGQRLLKMVEKRIAALEGRRIYVQVPQRRAYTSTRVLYENSKYHLETVLTDFYGNGDGQTIYCKVLKIRKRSHSKEDTGS